MALDWMKIELELPDKPEVVAMASALRIDQDAVVGKCVRLWAWANKNSVDGENMMITRAFIDRLANRRGFATAMEAVGWLMGEDGFLTFPRFDRHNGSTAKARALGTRRVEKHRGSGNAAGVTTPFQKALPEKRREEIPPQAPQGGTLARVDLIRKIKNLRVAWQATPLLSGKEHRAFEKNEAMLSGFTAADWSVLAEFYQTKRSDTGGRWQPMMLARFLADAGEVLGHARDWKSKQRPRLAVVPAPAAPVIIPREELAEFFPPKLKEGGA